MPDSDFLGLIIVGSGFIEVTREEGSVGAFRRFPAGFVGCAVEVVRQISSF